MEPVIDRDPAAGGAERILATGIRDLWYPVCRWRECARRRLRRGRGR